MSLGGAEGAIRPGGGQHAKQGGMRGSKAQGGCGEVGVGKEGLRGPSGLGGGQHAARGHEGVQGSEIRVLDSVIIPWA